MGRTWTLFCFAAAASMTLLGLGLEPGLPRGDLLTRWYETWTREPTPIDLDEVTRGCQARCHYPGQCGFSLELCTEDCVDRVLEAREG